jgi:hypothetical protein
MNSCGQIKPELQQFAAQNAAFSQTQWEIAKQDGCAPCSAAALPTWPPKDSTAFTYPMMANHEEVSGLDSATYGTPYLPTAAEQAANDPNSLVCSLPPQLRGSQFLPEVPLAASMLSVPDINFELAPNDSGNLVPMSGDMPSEAPLEYSSNVVTDTAREMQSDISNMFYHLTNLDTVPGDTVVDKLMWILSQHSRTIVLWVFLIFALAAMLGAVM